MKNKLGKKGMSLAQVPGVVVMLVILGIMLTIGAIVLNDIRDDQTDGSYAYNASDQSLTGVDNVAGWQDTIGTVIGAAVIISIVIGSFMVFRQVGS